MELTVVYEATETEETFWNTMEQERKAAFEFERTLYNEIRHSSRAQTGAALPTPSSYHRKRYVEEQDAAVMEVKTPSMESLFDKLSEAKREAKQFEDYLNRMASTER